jgi:hypothetical protein
MQAGMAQSILVVAHDGSRAGRDREGHEVVVGRIAKDCRRASRVTQVDAALREEAEDVVGLLGRDSI